MDIKSQRSSPSPFSNELSDPAFNGIGKSKTKRNEPEDIDAAKRRCVSTACLACRRRKSKCDGNIPACAACSSVYGTQCVYDPNSDHRRKGVYKKDTDNPKTRNSTLQTLIQAILNYPEDDITGLIREIRTCESLDKVAEGITAKENGIEDEYDNLDTFTNERTDDEPSQTFESQLSSKLGELRVDDGSVRFIGGTSNLLYLGSNDDQDEEFPSGERRQQQQQGNPIISWTKVTSDPELITHLLNMYFTWHYTFFTTLTKSLFYRDFLLGKPPDDGPRKYCTELLVNVMLALGCHFTSWPAAREDPDDSGTAGDHFFREAKRLIHEDDDFEKPRLTTVQALALMSVREAGCGRESKGWTWSGISFRMASDLGLNFHAGGLATKDKNLDFEEEDARQVTFWGCFLFDKCWSNYLGRLPFFEISSNITVPKFEVYPGDEAADWSPYSDSGFSQTLTQPSRVRAVALQILSLCEISSDLMSFFYHPQQMENPPSRQAELKRSSEIHSRLETWRRSLPKELEPKEGGLSSVLIMHMFFQLLYIHLFRPFLKYDPKSSPLPANVSPRKLCTHAAMMISKLLRLYKRSYGLRQVCNIAVYIAHSACTIHLLNLPDKNARRDITHGVKHLEEIAEGWLCARRTLRVLSLQARELNIELPEEAAAVLERTDARFGSLSSPATKSPEGESPTFNNSLHRPMYLSQMPSSSASNAQAYQQSNNGHMMSDTAQANSANTLQMMQQTQPRPIQISPGLMTLDNNASWNAYSSFAARGPEDMSFDMTHQMNRPAPITYGKPQQSQRLPTFQHPVSQFQGSLHEKSIASMVPRQDQRQQTVLIAAPIQKHNGMQPPPRPDSQTNMKNMPPRKSSQQLTSQTVKKPERQSPEPAKSRKTSVSDGSMFGGVEALLREGQDWWVKDQSQVESGFGNWNLDAGTFGNNDSIRADTPLAASPNHTRGNSISKGNSAAASGPVGQFSRNRHDGFEDLSNGYEEREWYQ